MLGSISGFSIQHVTMSVKNIHTTNHTIEYDLYVVNDGTTKLKMSACSFGVNFDEAIVNGGTITYFFKPQTRNEAIDQSRKLTVASTGNEAGMQARMTTSFASLEKSNELLPGIPFKIGRFTIINSNNWTTNGIAKLTLQELHVKGATTTSLLAFVDEESTPTLLTPKMGTVNTQVETYPILNALGYAAPNALKEDANAKWNSMLSQVNLYPNPASDLIYLNCFSERESSTDIQIYDLQGRLVLQNQTKMQEGENLVNLDIRSLVGGLYLIKIKDAENGITNTTFRKQ
jgi:hypothetical protein